MSRPATRLLQMLELLQESPRVSGAELASRLEIDLRTVRRYATRLQELGIPVEGERGRAGGYRLRPGYRMPPLMLDDEEATAVVVGLVGARHFGLADVDSALAKIRRVLPDALREQVGAVEETLGFTRAGPPPGAEPPRTAVVLALSDAARRGRTVRAWYESGRTGERTRRELDPYGLVVVGGRWYLSAFDHLTAERRIFRADRLTDVRDRRRAAPPPDGFDPGEHVATSLARVPWRWEVEVLLHDATVAAVRQRVPATAAELDATVDGGVRLRARAEQLDGMARLLASLGCDFTVVKPAELRDAVGALAQRLASAVS